MFSEGRERMDCEQMDVKVDITALSKKLLNLLGNVKLSVITFSFSFMLIKDIFKDQNIYLGRFTYRRWKCIGKGKLCYITTQSYVPRGTKYLDI